MLMFLASLLAPSVADTVPAVAVRPADVPAIQISFDNGAADYAPGADVGVRIQTRDDGYVVVFRVDGDGRVQVLFPLDPTLDAFVRGGKQYEIRGRGNQEAFVADQAAGTGLIYAAIAREPYAMGDFTVNGHWDYGAVRLRDSSTDAENDLTAIVSRMTNHGRFDYDAVSYHVRDIASDVAANATDGGYYPSFYDPYYDPAWRCFSCGWGIPRGGFNFTLGIGYDPYYYDPFYDPFFYDPFYAGFGYGYGGFYPTYPVYVPVGGRSFGGRGVVGRSRPRPLIPSRSLASGGVRGAAIPVAAVGVHRVTTAGAGRPSAVVGRGVQPSVMARPVAPATGGVRVRPRGNDETIVRRSVPPPAPEYRGGDARPVFREPPRPQTYTGAPAAANRGSSQPPRDYHPAYREPPQQQQRPQAAPAQRSAPPPRSPPPPSRGGGGMSASRAAPARGGHR